ncbi:hypothetical protein [Paenibacillus popilliae]|uniref:Uncharacterized protein n=1 Tax=Paenibacillus popilliae ATCC 14706 TaxID=1212764 RepID=M9LAQ4_PAEPP|nr:hypothetical protein [Paenibacillus popilliae]GAC42767.1 hypothetical protein PPOP_2127 [Paenibacillus popilliae ATCC 14706]
MNAEANKKVNELIINLSNYIEKVMKSDSADDHERLPSLIEALAKLTNL